MSSCARRAQQLSALVDGALGDRERDEVLTHLVDCAGCRAEVASLRALRERVAEKPSEPAPPSDLVGRLAEIAGTDRNTPLHARPFDPPRAGSTRSLPSRRRRFRHGLAGVLTGTCLIAGGAVTAGWFAAPPTRTPALDPGPLARSEFTAVLADNALSTPGEVAARATERGGPRAQQASVPAVPQQLATAGALELLARASTPTSDTLSGNQLVQIRHLQGFWVATAEVTSTPGQGVHLHVTGSDKNRAAAWLPAPTSSEVELLGRTHWVGVGAGPVIAGRASAVVEARRGERTSARWWIDPRTGELLWFQSLDADGSTVVSTGWTDLSSTPTRSRHPATQPDAGRGTGAQSSPTNGSVAMTTLDPGQAGGLTRLGWNCEQRLAGLDLVRIRRSAGGDQVVHTSYSDGVSTVSVLEQKGALAGSPDGFVWDPELRVQRGLGTTTTMLWQSGDRVFTVTTDGPNALAERAVGELPHRSPVLRTRTERVLDGWRHLVGAS